MLLPLRPWLCWFALWPLSGCALLLGPREAPPVPAAFQLREVRQSTSLPGLLIEGVVLGPGQRVVAARNLFGGVSRVVNPFGARSLLIQLRLSAAGGAHLKPAEARLSYDGQAGLPPFDLAHFRRRWPTWALRGADEEADQRVAYEAVLDGLLVERRLGPADSAAGLLAFPLRPLRERLSLTWPVQAAGVPGQLRLDWELR